jgi:hypothetical protein
MKRQLDDIVDEARDSAHAPEEPAALLSGLSFGDGSLITKLNEFLDELDEDGFDELNEFQQRNWRHFLDPATPSPSSAAAQAAAPAPGGMATAHESARSSASSAAASTARTALAVELKPASFCFGERVVFGDGWCARDKAVVRSPQTSPGMATPVAAGMLAVPAPPPPGMSALHRSLFEEFCGLLEAQITQFVGAQGSSLDELFGRVRADLRRHAEQQLALREAIAIAAGEDGGGGGSSSPRKRQRRGRVPIDRLFENEEEGVHGLLKFMDEACDPASFVEGMRDHAQCMARYEARQRGKAPKKCEWCNRKPCFDPWHAGSRTY